MKRNNKKGFTIVELVIVIAVIAILAGVLIPTFGGIVDQANESSAKQAARNGYTQYYAQDLADGKIDNAVNGTDMAVTGYSVDAAGVATYTVTQNGWTATFNGTTLSATKNP